MAKINHNDYLDTINDIFRDAQKRGVFQLFAKDEAMTGHDLLIGDRELINFGTCGYLGLEMEPELKQGAVDYALRFGTQFSMSRSYVTAGGNVELETLLEEIYKKPVIVSSATSTSHIAVIPTIIRDGCAIILDQQVHMSVQTACQLTRQRGVPIEMIRHSNMEMLERKIKELQDKYDKIWYMVDGVYSMYGDIAPFDEILTLMNKYESLHLYVDDAHGMSWYGKNGCGYTFEVAGIHERMILVTTLAKGFGVTGGVTVFPTQEMYEKVKVFGGPLSYSHPLAPPLLGAAIASAKIHLSDKIYTLQDELHERLDLCNKLLAKENLPVVSNPATPIYFIGMGHLRAGYNMVKRLLDEGFYLNIALFPAVPVKNSGVRFTVNRHQTLQDIEALVSAIAYHFPKALAEEGFTEQDVYKAFHKHFNTVKEIEGAPKELNKTYKIQHESTIKNIDRELWDGLFGKEGSFTWEALQPIEKAFSDNENKEDNWDFHYFVIRDESGKPVLATYFTVGYYKDDFISAPSVSMQIEAKRAENPFYLVSKTVAMGSLITEGRHLYIDRSRADWKEILNLLLARVIKIQEEAKADNLILRDFDEDDYELRDYMLSEGFVKLNMPNSNIFYDLVNEDIDSYLPKLSAKNRSHVRRDVLKYSDRFEVEIKSELTDEELDIFYDEYLQIKRRNFGINYFDYPKKVFQSVQGQPGWEFIILKLKKPYDNREKRLPVSIGACYHNDTQFCPMVLGLDYDYVYEHKVYKQALYQVLRRAQTLGVPKIYLGFSADTDKRKLGAKQVPRVAYMQANDNFNFELIESMAV